MKSRYELNAVFKGFTRPSAIQQEQLLQALAEILVIDYQQNQCVRDATVKSPTQIDSGLDGENGLRKAS